MGRTAPNKGTNAPNKTKVYDRGLPPLMGTAAKSLEGFPPLFGEAASSECPEVSDISLHRPFLFFAQASDPYRLDIIVSNFVSHTFQCSLTVEELDDLRDEIGVGGTWQEFVEYVVMSLSSGDVKLVYDGSVLDDTGTVVANLIARKSKGMPCICFSLHMIMNCSFNEATAKLSMALYQAFKENKKEVAKERNNNLKLTELLSTMKGKNEDLQKQLDAYTFKTKRASSQSRLSEKSVPISGCLNTFEQTLNSDSHQPQDPSSTQVHLPTKVDRHFVRPRRVKTRGALLQEDKDDSDIQ